MIITESAGVIGATSSQREEIAGPLTGGPDDIRSLEGHSQIPEQTFFNEIRIPFIILHIGQFLLKAVKGVCNLYYFLPNDLK